MDIPFVYLCWQNEFENFIESSNKILNIVDKCHIIVVGSSLDEGQRKYINDMGFRYISICDSGPLGEKIYEINKSGQRAYEDMGRWFNTEFFNITNAFDHLIKIDTDFMINDSFDRIKNVLNYYINNDYVLYGPELQYERLDVCSGLFEWFLVICSNLNIDCCDKSGCFYIGKTPVYCYNPGKYTINTKHQLQPGIIKVRGGFQYRDMSFFRKFIDIFRCGDNNGFYGRRHTMHYGEDLMYYMVSSLYNGCVPIEICTNGKWQCKHMFNFQH